MTEDLPAQRPEGKILKDAQKALGQSIRQVAASAGMSDARWRQIVNGYMHVSGVNTEVVAPASTLARMAHAVGLTPEQLVSAGREDAAVLLERMMTIGEEWVALARVTSERASQHLLQGSYAHGTVIRPADSDAGQLDEIDLIYASKMAPREKLLRIRQVLELRAQAEAEESAGAEADASETSDDPVHNH